MFLDAPRFRCLRHHFPPFVKGDSGGFKIRKEKSSLTLLFLRRELKGKDIKIDFSPMARNDKSLKKPFVLSPSKYERLGYIACLSRRVTGET
jgi:hypothetical protein